MGYLLLNLDRMHRIKSVKFILFYSFSVVNGMGEKFTVNSSNELIKQGIATALKGLAMTFLPGPSGEILFEFALVKRGEMWYNRG